MSPSQESVTSLTAQSLDPGKASERIFSSEGLLYSLWSAAAHIITVIGLKEAKAPVDTLHAIDFEKVASMGNFGTRPSDLFLKVVSLRRG
jgi:hypothetical protein